LQRLSAAWRIVSMCYGEADLCGVIVFITTSNGLADATIPTSDKKGGKDNPLLKREERITDPDFSNGHCAMTGDIIIGKNRLTPVGVSFASPVASNKTEEGRAKNRRVELVEN
jgi:hypothetical protein